MVFVLDLGFSQTGAILEAPQHGPFAAIDVTALHHRAQHRNFSRVVLGRHRQIRTLPVADTSEPTKIAALQFEPFLGLGTAAPAQLELAHGAHLLAKLARHLVLDRHAVAVTPGNERGSITKRRTRAHHEILEDLVERGT